MGKVEILKEDFVKICMPEITVPKEKMEEFVQIFNNFEHALKSELYTLYSENGCCYRSKWRYRDQHKSKYEIAELEDLNELELGTSIEIIKKGEGVFITDWKWGDDTSEKVEQIFIKMEEEEDNESKKNN